MPKGLLSPKPKKLILFLVVIAAVAVLFATGVFSVSVSTGDSFFSSKYYVDPMKAYKADGGIDHVKGDTSVKEQLGLVVLDESSAVFLGKVNDERFVVAELAVKDDKYAYKSEALYEVANIRGNIDVQTTKTSEVTITWGVTCEKEEIEKVRNVMLVEEFSLNDSTDIYIIVFED